MAQRPYRGARARKRNRLLLVLTLVLLVLIVGTVVFFALQEYIVFTADGFRFDFPHTAQGEPTTEPPATEPPPQVIIEEPATTTTQPTTNLPPQKPQGLTQAVLVAHDAYVPSSPLSDEIFHQAVMIQDRDGVAHIPTDAYGENPTAQQQALADAMAGTGDVAVFSYFRNHEGAARARRFAITVAGGATWLDGNSNRWLSPYESDFENGYADVDEETWAANPNAFRVGYGLIQTCQELEVREIVLQNFHFPTYGKLSLINYPEDDSPQLRQEIITQRAIAVRLSLASTATTQPLLSCVLTETAAALFVDEVSGQNVMELAHQFDILYVPTDDPNFDTGPLYEVVAGTSCRIGLWLTSHTAPQREIDFILVS